LQGLNAHWDQSQKLISYADFGESQGVGKILAQPQLRCKPGEKARFQAGGEIPITTSNPYNSSTQWKSYGLNLLLEPEANIKTGAQELSLAFQIELSEPDQSTAIKGIPGMTTRKLDSRFDLRTNELTLLSTLFKRNQGKNKSGIAFLSQLPLLSYLVSSENSRENESELWFAIKSSWEEPKVKDLKDYVLQY
jgi:Flp pilus assembly secretin CpaC